MKRCLDCNRTYQDDNQKFCTHDGGRLVSQDSASPLVAPATITPPDLPSPPTRHEPSSADAPRDLNATFAATPAANASKHVSSVPHESPYTGEGQDQIHPNASSLAANEAYDFSKTIASRPSEDVGRDFQRTNISLPPPLTDRDFTTKVSSPPPKTDRNLQSTAPSRPSGTDRDLTTRVSGIDPGTDRAVAANVSSPVSDVDHNLKGTPSSSPSAPESTAYLNKTYMGSSDTAGAIQEPKGLSLAPGTPIPTPPRQKVKKKTNWIVWVLAGFIGFGLIVAAIGVAIFFLVVKPRMAAISSSRTVVNSTENVSVSPDTNLTQAANANASEFSGEATLNSNANSNASSSAPPRPETFSAGIPANALEFVSSSARFQGPLGEHYLKFSFYYPKSWSVESGAGKPGATYFVEAVRKLPPNLTQEDLAVSWYESGGTLEADQGKFPGLVEIYSSRLAKGLSEYKKISEGRTTINSKDGYEFRFEGRGATERGEVKYWGRMVFLPRGVKGDTNGIRLLVLGTSLAPELTNLDDVGVKGEMPVILNSFKLEN